MLTFPHLRQLLLTLTVKFLFFFFFFQTLQPESFEMCNWREKKPPKHSVRPWSRRERLKWHNRKELEAKDTARSAALRSRTTLIADQFPTSNPVWQELAFLHTLQHFTPGRRYSSINNGAVNRAHKCPLRANSWVYVAQTDGYYRTAAVWFQSQLVKGQVLMQRLS